MTLFSFSCPLPSVAEGAGSRNLHDPQRSNPFACADGRSERRWYNSRVSSTDYSIVARSSAIMLGWSCGLAPQHAQEQRRGWGRIQAVDTAASSSGNTPAEVQKRGLSVSKHQIEALMYLLGLESEEVTDDIIRRRPELLEVPTSLLVSRLLALKRLLPGANLPEMLRLQPSLLLLEDPDSTVGAAMRQLRALMPGVPVESKLHKGGSLWWSFIGVCLEQLGDIGHAQLMLTKRLEVRTTALSWPSLLGQDARVVKAYLEHATGRSVQLVSAAELPRGAAMFNQVPGVLRRMQTLAARGTIAVVYHPRTLKVAISPRLI